jgi:allantoicase
MNFGEAIEQMKLGAKVAREGWNGKNMWVVLMPELKLPPFSSQEIGAKVNDRTAKHIGKDTPLHSLPYFAMWTAQGKWLPGWLASQTDMLAEDWVIVL